MVLNTTGTSLSPFATQPLHQWPSMGLRGLWKKGFTIRLSESGQLRQGNGKVGKSGVSKFGVTVSAFFYKWQLRGV